MTTTLNIEQAASLLHCHPDTLRGMAASGEVPAAKIGRAAVDMTPSIDWQTNSALQTLGITEIAAILRKSPKTVREDVSRRPEALPPRLIIPNSRLVVWRMKEVEEWLDARVQKPLGRKRNNT